MFRASREREIQSRNKGLKCKRLKLLGRHCILSRISFVAKEGIDNEKTPCEVNVGNNVKNLNNEEGVVYKDTGAGNLH